MDDIKEDQLQKQVIDLHAAHNGSMDESFLRMFGGAIQGILGRMFGGPAVPTTIRGTRREIESFAKTIDGEQKYIKSYVKYGLNDPRTYKNKYALENAVKQFEKTTSLKWPFR